MKHWLLILVFLLSSFFAKADEANTLWQLANHAYQNKNYEAATHLYDSMLKNKIDNAELYYNAGNAYYKNHKMGMAIWCYEMANMQSPNNDDIVTNLKIARLRLVDKIEAVPEFILFKWWNKIITLLSLKLWAILTVSFFWVMLLGWLLYYFSFNFTVIGKSLIWIGLFLGIIFLSISLALNSKLTSEKYTIIVATNTVIKSAPDNSSADLFVVHEGLKVKINSVNGNWVNVTIADAKVGWCYKADVRNL